MTALTLPVTAADPALAQQLRNRLADLLARREPRLDRSVVEAMRLVPRHVFVPDVSLADAYSDAPQPLGHGQTVSQPTVVAWMTSALNLHGNERVLEIGTGSGYQTAVLAHLAAEVASIERLPVLGERAALTLASQGYCNVNLRIGDGYGGWPGAAPFDRILLTAAPADLPVALARQVREGGIVVGPVGDTEQLLVRWTRRGDLMERETLGKVRFVPMVQDEDEHAGNM